MSHGKWNRRLCWRWSPPRRSRLRRLCDRTRLTPRSCHWRPVAPDAPDVAIGVELAAEPAEPVLPVLVAEDWATALPESPEMAVGMTVTFTDPPSPPLASPMAMESADVMLWAGPPAARVAPVALPALPDLATALPPAAPWPPVATIVVMLEASPVLPDVAMERLLAPVLAVESASPLARESPVAPESPEPERLPVALPVAPEPPESAVGLEPADDDAGPVSPVLVADDCALTLPELPEIAVETTVTSTLPPRPPLA